MAEHYYCHGPSCHTYVTTDRVRGTKGNKVLRTRKITINSNGYPTGFYKYFAVRVVIMTLPINMLSKLLR